MSRRYTFSILSTDFCVFTRICAPVIDTSCCRWTIGISEAIARFSASAFDGIANETFSAVALIASRNVLTSANQFYYLFPRN